MDTKAILDKAIDFAWANGPKTLAAIALLFGGLWLINRLTRGFDHFLKARNVDEGLRPFFSSMADIGMKIALVLMVASTVGIATTSFIAIFSAIAFSVGLALQGSLGNFASGVLLLLFRPFKVGDFITVADMSGYVVEIQIFNTILRTPTGKKIIVPNGKMTEGPIENIAENSEVQVEIEVLLQSGYPIEKIQAAASEAAALCPHVIREKPVDVWIMGVSRDDVKAEISVWTLGQHYEDTADRVHEAIRSSFGAAGIEFAKERRREAL